MIPKSFILSNLKRLDKEYRSATDPMHALFVSKLALLELCGWIEMSMDDLVRRLSKKSLKIPDNIKYVESQIIRRNYGFEYEKHFRNMCVNVFGLKIFELLERKANGAKIQKFKSDLASLKLARDSEAHTYVKGTTRNIDAPSLTISKFQSILDGFREIENILREENFL